MHLPWLAAAATVASCGGKALDIGFDQSSSSSLGGSGGASTQGNASAGTLPELSEAELAQMRWPADAPCVADPGSPRVGVWKAHWPDEYGYPSREAVLTLEGVLPDKTPCGTLRIGEGEPPPPATDPDEIYPPGVYEEAGPGVVSTGGTNGGPGTTVGAAWQGYAYRLLDVQVSDTRLAFRIGYNELLLGWCALQPSYDDSYGCLPDYRSVDMSTNGEPNDCLLSGPSFEPFNAPCFKIKYCNYRCFCYEGSCTAQPGDGLSFELHWDGPALEGSVSGSQLIFFDPVPPAAP